MSGRADELKTLLSLRPHPEGGWFAEHHRAPARVRVEALEIDRTASTAIFYLLEDGGAVHRRVHAGGLHRGPRLRVRGSGISVADRTLAVGSARRIS